MCTSMFWLASVYALMFCVVFLFPIVDARYICVCVEVQCVCVCVCVCACLLFMFKGMPGLCSVQYIKVFMYNIVFVS